MTQDMCLDSTGYRDLYTYPRVGRNLPLSFVLEVIFLVLPFLHSAA